MNRQALELLADCEAAIESLGDAAIAAHARDLRAYIREALSYVERTAERDKAAEAVLRMVDLHERQHTTAIYSDSVEEQSADAARLSSIRERYAVFKDLLMRQDARELAKAAQV